MKLLPELQVGYNLNSFKGVGADGKYYGMTPQFQSVQIGFSLPLFSSGQKARIQAAKINERIVYNEYQYIDRALKIQREQLLQSYENSLSIVTRFEQVDLKNAQLILETANRQFLSGEINYLEFVMLVNQYVAVKSGYVEALWRLNEDIVQIIYQQLEQ